MASKEDVFDVVDDNNRIIGQAVRSYIHKHNLNHRAAYILILNDGKILLQKRSAHKDTFPHCWTASVSGHVDTGETYLQAANREMGEEIGWHEQTDLCEIAYEPAKPETENEFVKIFTTQLSGPFQPNPLEIEELRWMTPSEIDTIAAQHPSDIATSFLYLWNKHKGKL
jgi:isopentenyl-diphosphate delta-isomerase type 1